MLFDRKYDRAIAHLKEKRGNSDTVLDKDNISDKLEKGDLPAMVISALLVILPAAIVVLGLLALFGYLFVVR